MAVYASVSQYLFLFCFVFVYLFACAGPNDDDSDVTSLIDIGKYFDGMHGHVTWKVFYLNVVATNKFVINNLLASFFKFQKL